MLHIWSLSGVIENQLVENLPLQATEFGKLACGIWKNLPRKTVVPSDNSFSLFSDDAINDENT